MDTFPKSPCCSVSRSSVSDEGIKKEHIPLDNSFNRNNTETENMILLPGGDFLMGSISSESILKDGEGPVRNVTLDSFFIDQYAVSNYQFQTFVNATNYKTEAEIYGWSFVFYKLLPQDSEKYILQGAIETNWWCAVEGAYWNQPEGPNSSINERMNHPVVHISWNDAKSYSIWAGKRLPTEAEWEYAARGGLIQNEFPWGNELEPDGEHNCNVWQGKFPSENTEADGYLATAPVDSFPPNQFSLYNMVGNVWEWCEDWFSTNNRLKDNIINPMGLANGTVKSMRGGSYLCHKSYCNRYRVAARTNSTPDSSAGNLGFRCVKELSLIINK